MFQNTHEPHEQSPRLLSRALLAMWVTAASLLSSGVMAAPVEHANLADALAYVGKHSPAAPVLDSLDKNRVVFVGEAHDLYAHHINQLAVLQALHQRNPNIAMGVEWFQQPFQVAVNDFLAGKISEAELLRRTEYFERWGYDYRQLRPIMEYAKANHIPVIALNAPVELTRKVSKGGLAALTTAERAQLPPVINPPDAAYRAGLAKIFAQHSKDKQQFENFLLVQRIWDETMARNVVRYLQAHPAQRMVVFSGIGHISDGAGIPQDVARQMPEIKLATVASSNDPKEVQSGMVDYFLPAAQLDLPATGKLGVMLDVQGKAVSIMALDANSAASKAGLQKGDRLASLDGVAIQCVADLKQALAQYKAGESVNMTVERKGEKGLLARQVILQ